MMKTNHNTPTSIDWHVLSIHDALARVGSSEHGLSQSEAEQRLVTVGPNRLPPPYRQNAWSRFLHQFHNILIYILLGAGAITAALGHWVDTGVIIGVVVINALIGFIQEGKAEKALDAIRNMLSFQATVLRDGTRDLISAELLVPGDVVFLQSGDRVPADLRLINVKELRVEEAALTGESLPVEKDEQSLPAQTALGDRTCMAYSSTLVTYGQGTGVVVATGMNTEIGRISTLLGKVQPLTTPLLRKMEEFGGRLSIAILIGALATFFFGIFIRNYAISDMFLASVGLAVAAIPEGLPAIITITLAMGVQGMAKRNAIIRRLPAVETLGSMTVICSDKTGTLTKNEMTVQMMTTATMTIDVSGAGYDPHGGFTSSGHPLLPQDHPDLLELARGGLLCNDATLEGTDGVWHIQGDPTEGALVTLGQKAGLIPQLEQELRPRTDVIPFESQHRFMATLHHDHAGHGFVFLKGAPERVLEMCTHQRVNGEDVIIDLPYWRERIDHLAGHGQRVLAVAFRSTDSNQRSLRFDDVETGLTLIGLFGIIDPPRPEAIEAIRQCREAGIRVKMITGDHMTTARTIGAQMGIGDGSHALSGQELESLTDEQLGSLVQSHDIFARTSPEHKLRLVQSLQANGQIVGMTGDGVNDAPALKRADVGIAMGIKGTEVAKEAAEMVLADDNFASIARAVAAGRTVFDNIQKSILFMLPTNGAESLVIVTAILFGRILPITPVQILWVNMITAVTLALALSFEPAESHVMQRPPRPPDEPILSRFLIWRISFVSFLAVAGTFGLFVWEREGGASIETARTVAVNMLVVFEAFYLLNARYFYRSVFSKTGLMGNPYIPLSIAIVLLMQVLFTYTGFMQVLFDTTGIGLFSWIRIVLVGAVIFLIIEGEKFVLRNQQARQARAM